MSKINIIKLIKTVLYFTAFIVNLQSCGVEVGLPFNCYIFFRYLCMHTMEREQQDKIACLMRWTATSVLLPIAEGGWIHISIVTILLTPTELNHHKRHYLMKQRFL